MRSVLNAFQRQFQAFDFTKKANVKIRPILPVGGLLQTSQTPSGVFSTEPAGYKNYWLSRVYHLVPCTDR